MKSNTQDPGLRVEGLRKAFDGRRAIEGVSFAADRGTVLGLLGPNGAGKTTTFLCLSGLLRPDGGSIAFGGRTLGAERARAISLIPETPECFPMLTVWEHLIFVARSLDLAPAWQREGAALLERFGLGEARDVLGRSLSKGMRQKTLIAATVLAGAPVLLFDEPMIGLDPRGQRELRELIRTLAAEGKAVLLSTHQIETAEALCDQVTIMKAGRTIASGAPGDLRGPAGARSLEDAFLEITA
jgi:ABC-type multidrug transport system ATPase subunit